VYHPGEVYIVCKVNCSFTTVHLSGVIVNNENSFNSISKHLHLDKFKTEAQLSHRDCVMSVEILSTAHNFMTKQHFKRPKITA